MKLPAWDYEKQRWDQWKAFHMGVSVAGICSTGEHYHSQRGINFIVFDTGEVVCATSTTRPWARGYYSALDVDLVLTRDQQCPQLWTPEGQRVPKAWLTYRGSQTLVIDRETKHAVKAGWGDGPVTMPERFRNRKEWPRVEAYFPGPGLPPVGKSQIMLAPPLKLVPPDELEKHNEIICPARAMLTLNEQHPGRTGLQQDGRYMPWSPARAYPIPWSRIMECKSWQDLSEAELYALWHHGVERWKVGHDYLLTEKP